MNEAVISALAHLAKRGVNNEVRLEAIRSLAIYRTHPQAAEALIYLAERCTIHEISIEAIKVLGGQYDILEND